MKRGIAIAAAATILAMQLGSSTSAQDLELDELVQISAYLDQNDIEGLRRFLLLNPQLLKGSSSLARQLRGFVDTGPNLPFYLGWEAATRDGSGDSARDDGPVPSEAPTRDVAQPAVSY